MGDLVDYEAGLVHLIVRLVDRYQRPALLVGEELFGRALPVVLDHLVGRVQNHLRRAVIALKQHLAHIGKILAQADDIPRVGSTPSVDRVVNDDAVGDVGVDLIHVQVVHQAVIGLPIDLDNLVVLNTPIHLDRHDHPRVEMTGWMQVVLSCYAARRLCVGQKGSESELEPIPCLANVLGEPKRRTIIEVTPPNLPRSSTPWMGGVAAANHLSFQVRVARVDVNSVSMPRTGSGAAAVAKHAYLDGDLLGCRSPAMPFGRWCGCSGEINRSAMSRSARLAVSIRAYNSSICRCSRPRCRSPLHLDLIRPVSDRAHTSVESMPYS